MDDGNGRYAERLDALQKVSQRLTVAGVSHVLRRHVTNCAPSSGDGPTMPVIDIGGGWRRIKALYFDGVLRCSYPYLSSRCWPVDADGIDRLASRVTVDYITAKADGDIDERRM